VFSHHGSSSTASHDNFTVARLQLGKTFFYFPLFFFFSVLSSSPIKLISQHKGNLALFFSSENIRSLSQPFKLALIGKFLEGQPSIDKLRTDFPTISLKGDVQLGVLDYKYILIKLSLEENLIWLWLK
jgi:hypothetical protein